MRVYVCGGMPVGVAVGVGEGVDVDLCVYVLCETSSPNKHVKHVTGNRVTIAIDKPSTGPESTASPRNGGAQNGVGGGGPGAMSTPFAAPAEQQRKLGRNVTTPRARFYGTGILNGHGETETSPTASGETGTEWLGGPRGGKSSVGARLSLFPLPLCLSVSFPSINLKGRVIALSLSVSLSFSYLSGEGHLLSLHISSLSLSLSFSLFSSLSSFSFISLHRFLCVCVCLE